VLKDDEGELKFLVSPDLRTLVKGDDWAYLNPLLNDIQQRAVHHPEDLFKQLSSLGVGPLVAREVGGAIDDSPSARELVDSFVELRAPNRYN